MKIGLVLPATPNYSETFFLNKIRGLRNQGFEVVLFTPTVRSDFNLCKVYKRPVVYKNKIRFVFSFIWQMLGLLPFFSTALRFFKLHKNFGVAHHDILKQLYLNSHILKTKDIDWLHFGFATQAVGSEFVAKAIGAKMAASFRGYDINDFPINRPNVYEHLWQNVDKIHSISKYLVTEAIGLGLNTLTPVSIITPAINFTMFDCLNLEEKIYNSDKIIICTVARFNWIKDIETAIKSIHLVKAKVPNIEYHIVGDGSESEKTKLTSLVEDLGLKDTIVFHGKLSHTATLQIMDKAQIYLQTSINEGFCNAVLEAQALGKLCIATNVGGLPENIEDNKSGWLVEPKNPEDISNKIMDVINLTENQKRTITKYAKDRAKKEFALQKQIQLFSEFYTS